MIPIQDLLHRIRWDPEFGRGEFVIGYYDRIEHEIIHVPFREIKFPQDYRKRYSNPCLPSAGLAQKFS